MFLISWLSGSGHRLSTGEPNSSGTLRVLSPGIQTLVNIFDANGETITQPVELDAAGKATVYVEGPVDLAFEDAEGAAVQTIPYGDIHGADGVLVESNAFTGALSSGSQGAGGRTYLDSVLDRALDSFGGTDWQFQESASAVPMPVSTWMVGVQLNVKGYGSKGDNLQVDTSSIQLAINRCAALGGGRVYFPPGTYLTDAVITVPANVALIGASPSTSIIKCTNATQNGLSVSLAGNNLFDGIQITHSGTSTGIAISCLSTTNITIRNCAIGGPTFAGGQKFLTGIRFDACNLTVVQNSLVYSNDSAGSGRGIIYATSGDNHQVLGGQIGNAGTAAGIDMNTGTNTYLVSGVNFVGSGRGVLLSSSGVTGLMTVMGCKMQTLATPFSEAASPGSRALEQFGNGIDGYTSSEVAGTVAGITGASSTPILSGGKITLRATTVGTYTIPALTTNPLQRGFRVTLTLWNNAGAPITAWNFNGFWHRSATAVSLTDANRTVLVFEFDPDVPCMREQALTVTS